MLVCGTEQTKINPPGRALTGTSGLRLASADGDTVRRGCPPSLPDFRGAVCTQKFTRRNDGQRLRGSSAWRHLRRRRDGTCGAEIRDSERTVWYELTRSWHENSLIVDE